MKSGEDKNQETFVVKILSRDNSTWQGTVTWVDENKTVSFRSALELLKLIDGAQNQQNNEWKNE